MNPPIKSPAKARRRPTAVAACEKSTVTHYERQFDSALPAMHTEAVREHVRIAAQALLKEMPGTETGIDIQAALEEVRHAK